jgi:hydroxylamine reductase
VQAVAVLLTLLNLGVKNIRLGPQLPAFCTPDMIDLLVKTFDLKAVSERAPWVYVVRISFSVS